MHHYCDSTETANQVTWDYSSDSESQHVIEYITTLELCSLYNYRIHITPFL